MKIAPSSGDVGMTQSFSDARELERHDPLHGWHEGEAASAVIHFQLHPSPTLAFLDWAIPL